MDGPVTRQVTTVPLGMRWPRISVSTVDTRSTTGAVPAHRSVSSIVASRYGIFVPVISWIVGLRFSALAEDKDLLNAARSLLCECG